MMIQKLNKLVETVTRENCSNNVIMDKFKQQQDILYLNLNKV